MLRSEWVSLPEVATKVSTRWKEEAACADADPAVFYPDSADFVSIKAAMEYCDRCPVLEPCAEWAVRFEAHGVWGGMSARERDRKRRAMKRHALLLPASLSEIPLPGSA